MMKKCYGYLYDKLLPDVGCFLGIADAEENIPLLPFVILMSYLYDEHFLDNLLPVRKHKIPNEPSETFFYCKYYCVVMLYKFIL